MFDRPSAPPPDRSILEEGIHDAYGLVWGNHESNLRGTVEYGTWMLLGAGLLVKGKAGYAAAAGLLALNEVKAHDTVEHQVEELAIGAVKGVAVKGGLNYIFDQNWSFPRKFLAGSGGAVALNLASWTLESTAHAADRTPSPTTTDVSGFRSTQYIPRFNGQVR